MMRNKKGDISSFLYTIAILFAAGIIIVVFSFLGLEIYEGMQTSINNTGYGNDTEAGRAIGEVISFQESSAWDYLFLAIAMTYFIGLLVLAYSVNVNPIFMFVYGVVSMIGFFVVVALANAWEVLATNPAMVETITRFPITNLLLDNYFPLFITVLLISMVVLLFGKFMTSREGGLG